ncbi:heme peroxidase family protein [Roseovarius sp. THAF9]|uniref:peroxidase family protein n=1 Tax=Roseovarius sp. THAF9 TaxID=2587847 RepID=UPI00156281F4|nr:heme peroxidase family protein [Roseovarius sp. THAF9]
MFRSLPPWSPPGDTEEQIDADIRAFAANAMAETDGDDQLDNANLPAGYTYFGQFVDHDITFDPTSSLMRQNDPDKLHNFRTPRLDLDCLYGEGPADEPFMYDTNRGGMFLIGRVQRDIEDNPTEGSNEPDLPRNVQGRALIGDMRNDENVIVSQFQLAMLRLHNAVYGQLIGQDPDDTAAHFEIDQDKFHAAQRIVRWFYQYVVWNDFIKRLTKNDIWSEVLRLVDGKFVNGARFYKWEKNPFMPVEFSVSAYRFGHSLIRPGYLVNLNSDVGLGFDPNDPTSRELPIFDPTNSGQHDLRGFRFFPHKHTVQWDWYFKMSSSVEQFFPQPARRIDPKLSSAVSKIPEGPGKPNLLATLNLLRSWRMEIPSGTAVAQAMGFAPHAIDDPHEDILWHYILKEAASIPAANSGRMLGNVGSTIVAEVFGGLLYGDPKGWVQNEPGWTPADEPAITALLPTGGPENGDWEVADLIRASGAPVDDNDVANTIANGRN